METLAAQPVYQFFGYLLAGLPVLSFVAVLILAVQSHLTLRSNRTYRRLRPAAIPAVHNSALKRIIYRP